MGIVNLIIDKFFQRPVSPSAPWDDLSGNVVIVTGASHGLGKSLAKQLYRHQAKLVLISRHLADLKKIFGQLDENQVLLLEADLSNSSSHSAIVEQAIARFGHIDVLINNVGLFSQVPFAKISYSRVENLFRTNFYSAFFMSQAVYPFMKQHQTGLIINIGSRISNHPKTTPHKVLYASTKYALEGFSKTLSRELLPDGIRVTCLMPGTMGTYLTPQKREVVDPDEVADFICNLVRLKNIQFESIVFKSAKSKL